MFLAWGAPVGKDRHKAQLCTRRSLQITLSHIKSGVVFNRSPGRWQAPDSSSSFWAETAFPGSSTGTALACAVSLQKGHCHPRLWRAASSFCLHWVITFTDAGDVRTEMNLKHNRGVYTIQHSKTWWDLYQGLACTSTTSQFKKNQWI